jgi:plastocyanin
MAATHQVTIDNMEFNPSTITIAAGDTVEWTNKMKVIHTATGDSGEFDSGNIAANKTFSHTFAAAGAITYHCEKHSFMTGTVEVSAAASGGGTPGYSVGEVEATKHQISIDDMAFNPDNITIAAGDTVEWTNNMGMTHTATGDSGEFDSGNIAPNKTFSHTFGDAGTITYHCKIHTFMTGTVEVSASQGG